jgi:GrpB-like predicted nucleotidyltransferase (UPF0157 family)
MPDSERHQDSAPTVEERVRRATVGEPAVLNDTITLVEYDPRWPLDFEREAQRIRRVLGDRALLVEHAGSTSVPGLTAKPIIDIVLAVENSADEPAYAALLQAAGYVLRIREPDWHEHRLFKGPDININLHVFTLGSPEIERMLLLRDHLRTDQADRDQYARTKRELAGKSWKYVQEYADAKGPVVEAIIARAAARVKER